MRLRHTLCLIPLTTTACVGQASGAATELAVCADANAPQAAIAACSTLIDSGEVGGKSLANVQTRVRRA
jgi:hypothetical protein